MFDPFNGGKFALLAEKLVEENADSLASLAKKMHVFRARSCNSGSVFD